MVIYLNFKTTSREHKVINYKERFKIFARDVVSPPEKYAKSIPKHLHVSFFNEV